MEKKGDSFFITSKKQNPSKKYLNEMKSSKEKQNKFDKNRPGLPKPMENGKKPFDKKTYRLKKYSKKYKLEQWEEQRKKRLLQEYEKTVKNDPMIGTYKPKTFDQDVPDSTNVGRFVKHPDVLEKELAKTKKHPFTKAKEQFNKMKEEKLKKQQENEKSRQEKNQKLQEYKKKKQDRFKKLSKKNKKGQPVMSGRMELLLEKIKSTN
ncbi:unnamed protein product [Pieris brassicae]|uniref:Thyroid transcription factor 1-associated protein 26 n=1 Tax=Pieris brassicae TaxID=7116 RepID=A0A9P0X9T5_PIEBR|nr:unnamed protein product [Pieris brassicae]